MYMYIYICILFKVEDQFICEEHFFHMLEDQLYIYKESSKSPPINNLVFLCENF